MLSLSPMMLPPAAKRTRSLFNWRVELATQDSSRLAAAGHPADIYLESWVLKRRAICLKVGKRAWALSPLNAHQRRSPHNHYCFQGNSRNSGPVSCSSSLGQRLVAWATMHRAGEMNWPWCQTLSWVPHLTGYSGPAASLAKSNYHMHPFDCI